MRKLDTYDPAWEERFDRYLAETQKLRAEGIAATNARKWTDSADVTRRTEIAHQEMQKAFHAQFETTAAYRDFLLGQALVHAKCLGHVLAFPPLSDDCTLEEVRAAYASASAQIQEQDDLECRRDVSHPEDLAFFTADHVRAGRVRSFPWSVSGDYRGFAGCLAVVDRGNMRAGVCLIHVSDGGAGATNAFEDLATALYLDQMAPAQWRFFGRDFGFKRAEPPNTYRPEDIEWFVYVPWPQFSVSWERVSRVTLKWSRGRYFIASWEGSFETIPPALDAAPRRFSDAPAAVPQLIKSA